MYKMDLVSTNSEAVSSQDFRNAYIDLYTQMRNYLWDINDLEKLANVEVDIYDSFMDMNKLKKDFAELKKIVVSLDDDELKAALDSLEELVQGPDPSYYLLKKVTEVSENEN